MREERQYKDSARMCFHAAIGIISLLLLAAVLSSCGTARSVTARSKDSTYVAERLTDKEREVGRLTDSVYVKDSIYVYQKGDTVTRYVERTRYRTTTRHDTVRIERLRADTVYAVKEGEREERREKPPAWYDKGFMRLGKVCCAALLLWAAFLYMRRRI